MRIAVVVTCLVLLAGCGGAAGPAGDTGGAAPAPNAEGPLDEFLGAPLVANVWASW